MLTWNINSQLNPNQIAALLRMQYPAIQVMSFDHSGLGDQELTDKYGVALQRFSLDMPIFIPFIENGHTALLAYLPNAQNRLTPYYLDSTGNMASIAATNPRANYLNVRFRNALPADKQDAGPITHINRAKPAQLANAGGLIAIFNSLKIQQCFERKNTLNAAIFHESQDPQFMRDFGSGLLNIKHTELSQCLALINPFAYFKNQGLSTEINLSTRLIISVPLVLVSPFVAAGVLVGLTYLYGPATTALNLALPLAKMGVVVSVTIAESVLEAAKLSIRFCNGNYQNGQYFPCARAAKKYLVDGTAPNVTYSDEAIVTVGRKSIVTPTDQVDIDYLKTLFAIDPRNGNGLGI